MRPGTGPSEVVEAWHPAVPGVTEALRARFVEHAYPAHVHDAWTLLVVESGAVRFDLDRRAHGTAHGMLTLLPPDVAHDGRAATPSGFRKRVVYLGREVLQPSLVGPAVDRPVVDDARMALAVRALHRALEEPGEELAAETRLAVVVEQLRSRLGGVPSPDGVPGGAAARLRDLLEAHLRDGLTLADAAHRLGAAPAPLVRGFRATYGLPPHRYLVTRRVDVARRLLLAGVPPAVAAVEAGFHDQAHLTRHFRRVLGVTPGRFAASGRRPGTAGSAAPA